MRGWFCVHRIRSASTRLQLIYEPVAGSEFRICSSSQFDLNNNKSSRHFPGGDGAFYSADTQQSPAGEIAAGNMSASHLITVSSPSARSSLLRLGASSFQYM